MTRRLIEDQQVWMTPENWSRFEEWTTDSTIEALTQFGEQCLQIGELKIDPKTNRDQTGKTHLKT